MKALQAIVLMIAAALTVTGSSTPANTPRKIEIQTKRFGYEPNEITVKKGEPVTLLLKSSDVSHGLAVKDLGLQTEVKKGKPMEVTFTPQQAGTFEGKCSHFCGVGHGSMSLKIHVTE